MDMGRRAFLLGHRPRRIEAPFRPPWAMDETAFHRACKRCGDCISACPTGLLIQGAGGFPEADFSQGHCTFCADCTRACTASAHNAADRRQPALFFSPGLPAWPLAAMIGAACLPRQDVLCRACGEYCEAGAIRFSLRAGRPPQPDIDTSLCTGCGECVAVCPARAISMRAGDSPPPRPAATGSPP
ncbi:MAG: ferredoxin-type protein NapF [Azoarcus sp.]|jgi:ferredoxin-type protein NapF|nr:ferredoxin-type protein NapF [Azoarcus sp.]